MVSAGNDDVFLVRYAANGNAAWAKRFGDGTTQLARGLAIDGAGRITIVGEMAGNVDFGGGPVSSGGLAGFVAQFESDGDHRWSKLLATTGDPMPTDVATDGLANVLVTGIFVNASDFGGGPLASDGSGDVFLLKLAPSGTHVWSQRFGDFQDQSGLGVAGSATGRVGVTGTFRGGINLGDGPKNAQGTADLFVGVFGP